MLYALLNELYLTAAAIYEMTENSIKSIELSTVMWINMIKIGPTKICLTQKFKFKFDYFYILLNESTLQLIILPQTDLKVEPLPCSGSELGR